MAAKQRSHENWYRRRGGTSTPRPGASSGNAHHLPVYLRAALAILAVALILPFIARRTQTFYTDGGSVREPVEGVRRAVRKVLWGEPRLLSGFEGSPEAAHSEPRLSPDGRLLVFTVERPEASADLWWAERHAGGWTSPEPFWAMNSDSDDRGASFSPDGDVLFFASDRPGGAGGFDLWWSRRDGDGWTYPENLGGGINGPANEISPVLNVQQDSLFFASDRASTAPPSAASVDAAPRASFDVYRSALVRSAADGTTLSVADALLRPVRDEEPSAVAVINDPEASEYGLAFSPAGDFLYFTSDRQGGAGGFDLYRARVARDGLTRPESLGPRVNSAADDQSPAAGTSAFELYFASDRGGRAEVFFTRTHEVYLESEDGETYWSFVGLLRWLGGWAVRTQPTILALWLSIVLCTLVWFVCSRRHGRLGLILRCLLIALLVHLLAAVWMDTNRVRRFLLDSIASEETTYEFFEISVDGGFEESVASAIRGATAETGSDDLPPLTAAARRFRHAPEVTPRGHMERSLVTQPTPDRPPQESLADVPATGPRPRVPAAPVDLSAEHAGASEILASQDPGQLTAPGLTIDYRPGAVPAEPAPAQAESMRSARQETQVAQGAPTPLLSLDTYQDPRVEAPALAQDFVPGQEIGRAPVASSVPAQPALPRGTRGDVAVDVALAQAQALPAPEFIDAAPESPVFDVRPGETTSAEPEPSPVVPPPSVAQLAQGVPLVVEETLAVPSPQALPSPGSPASIPSSTEAALVVVAPASLPELADLEAPASPGRAVASPVPTETVAAPPPTPSLAPVRRAGDTPTPDDALVAHSGAAPLMKATSRPDASAPGAPTASPSRAPSRVVAAGLVAPAASRAGRTDVASGFVPRIAAARSPPPQQVEPATSLEVARRRGTQPVILPPRGVSPSTPLESVSRGNKPELDDATLGLRTGAPAVRQRRTVEASRLPALARSAPVAPLPPLAITERPPAARRATPPPVAPLPPRQASVPTVARSAVTPRRVAADPSLVGTLAPSVAPARPPRASRMDPPAPPVPRPPRRGVRRDAVVVTVDRGAREIPPPSVAAATPVTPASRRSVPLVAQGPAETPQPQVASPRARASDAPKALESVALGALLRPEPAAVPATSRAAPPRPVARPPLARSNRPRPLAAASPRPLQRDGLLELTRRGPRSPDSLPARSLKRPRPPRERVEPERASTLTLLAGPTRYRDRAQRVTTAPSVLEARLVHALSPGAVPTAVLAAPRSIRPIELASPGYRPARAATTTVVTGSSFVPQIYRMRSQTRRVEVLRRGGGSALTEVAVERGLAWLALHQSPDGRWSLRDYAAHLPAPSPRDLRHPDWSGRRWHSSRGGSGRARRGDTAATGLALLCFLGHGDTHLLPGPYQERVADGLDWLVSAQLPDGDLRGDGNLYMHGIATFALCEAYAFTRDPKLREPAQRAIDFTVRAQNPHKGGWRYLPYPESDQVDTSVFGWMLMAVKSARIGGLTVDPSCLDRAAQYLNSARMTTRGGRYAYQPGLPRNSYAMTAQGFFCQQVLYDRLLAQGRTPVQLRLASKESVTYLLNHLPRAVDQQGVNFYYWYYATLALFQEGGKAWRTWNKAMSQLIVLEQLGDEHGTAAGSWDPRDRRASFGGRVYTTAMSVLILEVYYRYAQIEEGEGEK